MLDIEGRNVPKPPAGLSTVVISSSPNPIVMAEMPNTPEAPNFWPKPILLIVVPEPLNHFVLVNSTSVLLMCAKPAMLPNMASAPRIEEELANAQPEERAHGLINSWVAPAEPARSGLPAKAAAVVKANAMVSAVILCCFVRIVYFRIVCAGT